MLEPGPLFIVGMPRSGTKLLRDLLNRHPRVAIPSAETEFLPWLVDWVARRGEPTTPQAFAALWAALRTQQFFSYRAEAGAPIDPQRWRSACRRSDAAGLFEGLVRLDTGSVDRHDIVWGDKSPSYVDDIPLIRAMYPSARILHLVRDVRDYCVSMNRAWGKHMLRAAQKWVDGVDAARLAGRALGGDYRELRYEALLDDTEGQLRALCGWLALEFDGRMLTLERPSENLGSAKGAVGVLAGNHGQFRQRLSPTTLARIEALAGPTLQQLGYPLALPSQPPIRLGRATMLAGQAWDGLQLLRFERAERGWIGAAMFHLRRYRAAHSGRAASS